MKMRDIAIATITRTRDQSESHLIARALTRLSAHSLPIAVADGGSSSVFIDRIRRLRGVTLVAPAQPGLIAQVQASVTTAHATGRTFILYTEPDKHRFFGEAIGDFIRRAPIDAGIVLAARSAAGFKTFPRFQRLAETGANELCSEAVGITTDYFYGPFLLHRRLAAQVARASQALGWGWRPYLFATARQLGFRLAAVVGDYRCPLAQRIENDAEKEHRLHQLMENVRGIFAGTAGGAHSSVRRSRERSLQPRPEPYGASRTQL